MSKKNSSVNLKNFFDKAKDLSNIFLKFKNKLDTLNKKFYWECIPILPDIYLNKLLIRQALHF